MKDHNTHKRKGILLSFCHQLLLIDFVRHVIVRVRFFIFVKVLKRLKTLESISQDIATNTINHNLKGIKDHAAVRPLALIKPLSVIESLSKDSKVLTIGPRSEGELFALVGYGFMPKNIKGLDLISFSSWIELGDMHDMPYEDDSFDVVLMGWVIAYSNTPELAAKEVVRVLKPGGVVAVGVEHAGEEGKQQVKDLKYTPGAGRETDHTGQILKFFGENVDHIYFDHSIIPERDHLKGSVLSVFSIKK